MDANSKRAWSNQGSTLIEVVFGVLILAIMAMAIMMATRHPRSQAVASVHRQAAVQIANEVLEAVVSKGYARLDTGGVSTAGIVDHYDLHGRDVTITPSRTKLGGKLDGYLVSVVVAYPGNDTPVRVSTFMMRGSP